MADGALTVAVNGNVRYDAGAGDLTLGELRTGADVSLIAGNVVDAEDGADANVDITADELKVDVDGAFGESDDHIRTTVRQMSGDAGTGGWYQIETDGLVIGETSEITVERVPSTGVGAVIADTTDAVQTDLGVGDALVVVVEAGSLETLTTGAITAGSNVLLRTDAAMGDITLGANLVSTTGAISLDAGQSLIQNADVTANGAGRSIDVVATGVVTMADGTQTTTSNGNVRVEVNANLDTAGQATAANDLTLASINAGTGDVSLIAGNVIDAGDTHLEVIAAALRIDAEAGAGNDGMTVDALEVDVDDVSARAEADGLYLDDVDDITVTLVDAITVDLVKLDGTVTASTRTDMAQEDVITGATGSVVIEAEDITVLEGTPSSVGIVTGTTGNLRLQARSLDVDVQAQIQAITGHATFVAAQDVLFAGIENIVTNFVDDDPCAGGPRYHDVRRREHVDGDGSVLLDATRDIGVAEIDVGTAALRWMRRRVRSRTRRRRRRT